MTTPLARVTAPIARSTAVTATVAAAGDNAAHRAVKRAILYGDATSACVQGGR